jgi:hypothetical protein
MVAGNVLSIGGTLDALDFVVAFFMEMRSCFQWIMANPVLADPVPLFKTHFSDRFLSEQMGFTFMPG